MDVSIIIVNYNTRDLLHDCIQSIHDVTAEISYEVIVVDNASDDGSLEMVKNRHPDVKVLESRKNLGFGRGNNWGMRQATGKYCLLLNPDSRLVNNAVKIMFDFMENAENCEIGVCGANLCDVSLKPAVSFGRFPTLGSMILYSLPLSQRFRNDEGLVMDEGREPFAVDFVTGADFFVRRELIDSTGGFDEKYFAYYEETDLAYRLSQEGHQSVIVPSARIIHLEGKSFNNALKRKKIMYESSLYYLSKYDECKLLFKLYCLINEAKFSIYRFLSQAESASLWSEMVSTSRRYRTKK